MKNSKSHPGLQTVTSPSPPVVGRDKMPLRTVSRECWKLPVICPGDGVCVFREYGVCFSCPWVLPLCFSAGSPFPAGCHCTRGGSSWSSCCPDVVQLTVGSPRMALTQALDAVAGYATGGHEERDLHLGLASLMSPGRHKTACL